MAWENLEEDIKEELSDIRAAHGDLLRVINKAPDKAASNFYNRWYYLRHREQILERKRQWRKEHAKQIAAYEQRRYEKKREDKKAYAAKRRARLRQTEEGRQRIREESRRARSNGSTERYLEKLKQDPVRLEKLRAAKRLRAKLWREKKKAEKWQSAHQSSLKVKEPQSGAA